MVAKNKPTGNSNPFTMLTGGKTPQIYKNGVPAQVSDIRQYDVGTYDKNSNTLFVSDLRLCGLYEDASPNAAAPSTITVMGATLEVLPSAVADLSAFKVGDKVTFLLSSSGQVAGAVSPSVAQSNAIGVAKVDGSSATVQLLDGQLNPHRQDQHERGGGPAVQRLAGECLFLLQRVSLSEQGQRQRRHQRTGPGGRQAGRQDPLPRRALL